MKIKEYYLYWLLLLFLFIKGCQRDEYTATDGEGSLRLSIGMKNDLKSSSYPCSYIGRTSYLGERL